jgi:hypothetical protein
MEPEGSLPCSKEPSNGPYPKQINPIHTISFYLSLRFILTLSIHLYLGLPCGLFPSGFPTNILYAFLILSHVRWVPCHHGMTCPQVADGGDALQVQRKAENIFNKQSRTAEKKGSSSLEVERGTNSSSP